MEEESFGIREAFRREPEQTSFLIRFGLGGAFVIGVYSAIAGMVLNSLLAQPITLVITLGYGFILVISTARLVSSAVGRRFVESQLSSRTPHRMAERGHGEGEQNASLPAPEAAREQPSFSKAFFMLRLQDEVANARRDGREMCVAAIEATAPGMPMNSEMANRIAIEFAKLASSQSLTISHTLGVNESEYVMSLPNTDAAEAKAFVSKVVQALGNYWCHFGIAVYPADATSAESMVRYARQAVEESHDGTSSSKSHAVA